MSTRFPFLALPAREPLNLPAGRRQHIATVQTFEAGQKAVEAIQELPDQNGNSSRSSASVYGRSNPFPAHLLTNRRLNAPGSAKDTRHFEISLGSSAINYQVGDALGVVPSNCPVDLS